MNLVQDYVLKFSDQAVHPIDVKHSFELYGRAESQQGKTVSRQHQRLKIDTSGLYDQHFARKQDIKLYTLLRREIELSIIVRFVKVKLN